MKLPIGPQQFSGASHIPPAAARLSGAAAFLLCWLAAAGIQAIRVVWSLLCGLRLKRMSEAAGPDLESHFRRLCARVRTRRTVRISVSTKISSPAVLGYLRPHVIVPAGLACSLTSEEAEQVILHELAHVARYDDISIAIQRVLEAIAVFHPIVRYLGRRLDLDREMACDDYVASIHESKRYAACLAKVAEIRPMQTARIMLVPFLDRESELLTRVRVLLDKTRTHVPRISGRRLALVSAACIALGAIGLQAPRLLALPVSESSTPPVKPTPPPGSRPTEAKSTTRETQPRPVADLIALFDTAKDRSTKRAAISDLSGHPSPEVREKLFSIASSDSDIEIRKTAISYISGEGAQSLNALWKLYKEAKDTGMKLYLLSYIDGLNTTQAHEKLRAVASSERNPKVRLKALDYLSGR